MDEYYVSKTFLKIDVSPNNKMFTRTMRMIHRADCIETVLDTIKNNLAIVIYDEVLISIRRVGDILSTDTYKVI